jgi:hypothetical protein
MASSAFFDVKIRITDIIGYSLVGAFLSWESERKYNRRTGRHMVWVPTPDDSMDFIF